MLSRSESASLNGINNDDYGESIRDFYRIIALPSNHEREQLRGDLNKIRNEFLSFLKRMAGSSNSSAESLASNRVLYAKLKRLYDLKFFTTKMDVKVASELIADIKDNGLKLKIQFASEDDVETLLNSLDPITDSALSTINDSVLLPSHFSTGTQSGSKLESALESVAYFNQLLESSSDAMINGRYDAALNYLNEGIQSLQHLNSIYISQSQKLLGEFRSRLVLVELNYAMRDMELRDLDNALIHFTSASLCTKVLDTQYCAVTLSSSIAEQFSQFIDVINAKAETPIADSDLLTFMEIFILATKSIIRVDAKEKTRMELLIHHLSTNCDRLVTQLINENHYSLAIILLDYTLDKYHLLQMTNDSAQIQSQDQKKIEIDLLKHQAICYYRMAQSDSSLSVEKSIHYFFKAFKACCLIATADNDLKNLKNTIQQCILTHHNNDALLTAYHLAKTFLAEPRYSFMQVPLAIILVKIAMTIGLQCEKAQDYLTIKDKYYETLVAVKSISFSHSETILIKKMKQQLLTYILSYVSSEPTDYAKSIEMAVWGLHYFRSLDLSDTTELTISIGSSLGIFLASHLNHFTELSLAENNPEAFIKPIAALIEMPTHDCIEKIILLRALITVCISAGVKHDDQKDFIRAVDYFARAKRFWQQMPRETINDTDYLTHSIISRYQAQVHYHQFEMQPTTNNNDEILTKANYLITAARCLDELSEKNITDTDVNNYEIFHTHLEESLMIIEDNIDVLAEQCISISTQPTQLFFHTSFARVVQSVLKDVIEDKSYIRLNAACIIIKDYMQKMPALRDNICFQRCERYLVNCLEICRYLLKDRALLVTSQHSQQNNGLSLSQFSR